MQLPKYKKHDRKKLKICQEPGCGKEFWGHPIAKYCEVHQDIRNRSRKRRVYDKPDVKNQIFEHTFQEVTNIEFTCAVKGCNNKFSVQVYPKQFIYPKYCEEHRNDFKREAFERTQRKELETYYATNA